MEFPFDLDKNIETEIVQRIDQKALKWMNSRTNPNIQKVIDEMGRLSAKTQNLRRPITTFEKFANSEDEQIIYLVWKHSEQNSSKTIVIGYLKTCVRKLYLMDKFGKKYVKSPLSVLDFFVHSNYQKQGYGLMLFKKMIECESIEKIEERCAFDKPTNELLNFLKKNFNLVDAIWQPTNMVVFSGFFNNLDEEKSNNFKDEENLSNNKKKHRNSYYDGMPSSSLNLTTFGQTDSVGDVIHFGDRQLPKSKQAALDTPQGRKYSRDFSHQNIW